MMDPDDAYVLDVPLLIWEFGLGTSNIGRGLLAGERLVCTPSDETPAILS